MAGPRYTNPDAQPCGSTVPIRSAAFATGSVSRCNSPLLRPVTETLSLPRLAETLRQTCSELSVLSSALKKRQQAAPAETARASARRIARVAEALEQRPPTS